MRKLTQELGAVKASCVLVLLHVTKSWAPPLRKSSLLIFGFILAAEPRLGLGTHWGELGSPSSTCVGSLSLHIITWVRRSVEPQGLPELGLPWVWGMQNSDSGVSALSKD